MQQQRSASERQRLVDFLAAQGLDASYAPSLAKREAARWWPNTAAGRKADLKRNIIRDTWQAFVNQDDAKPALDVISAQQHEIVAASGLNGDAHTELHEYINEKIGNPHYVESPNVDGHVVGAEFRRASTNLRKNVIRSASGELFQQAGDAPVWTTERSQLHRFRHFRKNASTTPSGAAISQAPSLVMAKIRSPERARPKSRLEHDHEFRNLATSLGVPVSELNELAKVDQREMLFTDYAENGNAYNILQTIVNDRRDLISQPYLDKIVRTFILQIVRAVETMHAVDLHHGEIFMKNFLLANDGRIVVSDFSHASDVQRNRQGEERKQADRQALGRVVFALSFLNREDRDQLEALGKTLMSTSPEQSFQDVRNMHPILQSTNIFSEQEFCGAVRGEHQDLNVGTRINVI